MPACCEMTVDDRRKYLKRVQLRYLGADRTVQSGMLAEMEAVTGLHRKSLIRLLHQPTLDRQQRSRQRGRVYGIAVEDVIRVVWESLDYVCVERLTPSLLPVAQHLARFEELRLTAEVEGLLGQINQSTVQRLLTRFSQDTPKLPRRGPEQANRLARDIPMGRLSWQITQPGYFEVDLVHHCGATATGDYIHTLQLVDVASGWSERVAVLGRSQRAMEIGFRHVLERLPFPILHLHPDNGSEFLNDHLIRFWGEEIVGLKLSRSRPYHKNDNRFVEQKNDTLVRAYFGHVRLDTLTQCETMNAIYNQMWTYYNLYQPVMHLITKEVNEDKVKRKWDEAQAPYRRVLASGVLSEEQAVRLSALYTQTNPRQLRRETYQEIGRLLEGSDMPPNRPEKAAVGKGKATEKE